MKNWKTTGLEEFDVISLIKEIISENPKSEVWVGTDSQNGGVFSWYAATIAIRFPGKGVKCIWDKWKIPKEKNMYTRLMKEVEESINIAEWLKSNDIILTGIDLDINSLDTAKSQRLLSAARGWCENMGYRVTCKPNEQCAVIFSDGLLH